ncbi:SDR family oxidoreductase [Cryptosporangium phraense]|uniref:SDR family oxidoreductase n=1 Tax=Cryptosporangium phraense TaxID=2593070 RepID=A0A545AQN9_9ACTN|nr:SDR family oxidoreductase [Cryptosporangium phraense]TQS43561.1 SDR family oxidoreductase [Cryptosporangium phraense]
MPGKTALVLGGTSGIGLATARQLRALGATVHVSGRDKRRLDDLAATDPDLIGHRSDAADPTALGDLAASVNTIDWLVVTVSGAEGMGPVADLDLDVLRRAFDAKFWVHLGAIKAVLPQLSADGSITLVSASSARMGMPGTAGLSALNAAVEGLVRPLAVELAPIRVNAVSPGLVDTPWWSSTPDDARRALFDQIAGVLPARRVASADDVAEAVVLAATNRNLTGTVLESDGGARLVSLA